MTSDLELVTGHLRDNLRLLAKPASEQIEYLRTAEKFLLPVDELAHDHEQWTQSYISLGGVVAVETIREIDALLEKNSGQHNADHWTEYALKTDPMWEDVRRLACNALDELAALDPGSSPG
ncbi:MAG: hypothetical protein ACX939_03400 [Hyphococcus sp.]